MVAWGQTGERAAENLRKGGKVYIEGRIQTRQWEDQSGQKRYTTELIADRVTNLERRPREDGDPGFTPPSGANRPAQPQRTPDAANGGASNGGKDELDQADLDDLPF